MHLFFNIMNKLYIFAIILLSSCVADRKFHLEQSAKLLNEDSNAVMQPFYKNSLVQVSDKMVHMNKDYEVLIVDTASGNIASYKLSAGQENSLRAKYKITRSTDTIAPSYKFNCIAAGDKESFFVSCGFSTDKNDTDGNNIYSIVSFKPLILEFDKNFKLLNSYVMPKKETERFTCIFMISMPFGVKNDTLYTGTSSSHPDSMRFMADRYLLSNDTISYIGHATPALHAAYKTKKTCSYYFPNFSSLDRDVFYNDQKNCYSINGKKDIALTSAENDYVVAASETVDGDIPYIAWSEKSKNEPNPLIALYVYDHANHKSIKLKELGLYSEVYSIYVKENIVYAIHIKNQKPYLEKMMLYADKN